MCRFSVFDIITLLNPQCVGAKYAFNTWEDMKKTSPFQGADFSSFKFDGKGQKGTPVATIDGVLKIVDHFKTPVAERLKAPQRELFLRTMRENNLSAMGQASASTGVVGGIDNNSQQLIASAMQQIASTVVCFRDDAVVAREEVRDVRAKAEEEIANAKRKAEDHLVGMHEAKRQAAVLEAVRETLEATVKSSEIKLQDAYKVVDDAKKKASYVRGKLDQEVGKVLGLQNELADVKKELVVAKGELAAKDAKIAELVDVESRYKEIRNGNMVSGRSVAKRFSSRQDNVHITGVRSQIEREYRTRNGYTPLKLEFDFNGGIFTDEMYTAGDVSSWIKDEIRKM